MVGPSTIFIHGSAFVSTGLDKEWCWALKPNGSINHRLLRGAFGEANRRKSKRKVGCLVLTLLCGIHSRSALGITSSSGWNSSQNPTTSPTSLPPTVGLLQPLADGLKLILKEPISPSSANFSPSLFESNLGFFFSMMSLSGVLSAAAVVKERLKDRGVRLTPTLTLRVKALVGAILSLLLDEAFPSLISLVGPSSLADLELEEERGSSD
ncbi:hypothetical protein RND71_019268 [Anisodus tanguticus]|uniref:Uncharacterized protein n=1 Tax=Anisodus tanguticus TaxID=243964 RepID=A0AAE1RYS4_9SOLA|nr:hypothetical protein RND71_019268 [Anisodus tanguticus]